MFVGLRRAFAFKALFAKSSGSIYSLFLSEDPPATKALNVKSQRHGKEDTKQIFHRVQRSCGCGVSNISSRKTTFFSLVFITVFSFLRIINFFVCITCDHPEGILNLPFASAHDETRECIFAAFRMPIRVDARIRRRDRSTWSIYYSLFQYRRCDRQSVDVEKQCSRFILSNTFCTFCTI